MEAMTTDEQATTIAELRAQVQQLHYKMTCMCGSYVYDHGIGDGHSPVPMYDYALDQAEARVTAAERALAEMQAQRDVLAAKVAFIHAGLEDMSFCPFCQEDLWTEEAVKKGFAKKPGGHAPDCGYVHLPASAARYRAVVDTSIRMAVARAKVLQAAIDGSVEKFEGDEKLIVEELTDATNAWVAAVAALGEEG
jgi:hypothetical protein